MKPFRILHQHWLRFFLITGLLLLPMNRAAAYPPLFNCGSNPTTTQLLGQTSQAAWVDWIEKLSGEESVQVDGSTRTISTRYSHAMFDGSTHALAYNYVLETLQSWYPAGQIEEDPFTYWGVLTWKNLILTIPGSTHPEEVIIMSAHLDSTSQNPTVYAPGAEDNASGSAALLEAARLLQGQQLARTIRLIWFTGEEQGLIGSLAYVNDHDLNGVLGVINLDMYGYDNDDDGCFEIHVGSLSASDEVGACMVSSIQAYNIPLSFDYITTGATTASDHASFWNKGVGAVEIGENFDYNTLPGGCAGSDSNPYYHTTNDTLSAMNLPVGFQITQAALATLFNMAGEAPPNYPVFLPVIRK